MYEKPKYVVCFCGSGRILNTQDVPVHVQKHLETGPEGVKIYLMYLLGELGAGGQYDQVLDYRLVRAYSAEDAIAQMRAEEEASRLRGWSFRKILRCEPALGAEF